MARWYDKPVRVFAAARLEGCGSATTRTFKARKANEVMDIARKELQSHEQETGHDGCATVKPIGFVASCQFCKAPVARDPTEPYRGGDPRGAWRTFSEAVDAARIHESTKSHQSSAAKAMRDKASKQRTSDLVDEAFGFSSR